MTNDKRKFPKMFFRKSNIGMKTASTDCWTEFVSVDKFNKIERLNWNCPSVSPTGANLW